jgi:AcrR family transcriptional regulator
LVTSATARFAEKGFDRATTGEIARDAGVAEGTLFLHFGSKTGLLLGVMESYYDELVEALAEEASRGGTPEGRLRTLVRFWLRRMRRDWSLVRVFGQHGRFSDDPEMVSRFVEMNRKVTRFFGGLFADLEAVGRIRPGIPAYLLRDALFGTAEHLLISIESTGRERDLHQAADLLCDLLLGAGEPAKEASAESSSSTSSASAEGQPTLASLDAKLDRLLEAMAEPAPSE